MRESIPGPIPVAAILALSFFALSACADQPESDAAGGEAALEQKAGEQAMPEGGGEHYEAEGREGEGERGEHGEEGEGGEHGEEGEGGEGEESGVYIAPDETWDATRRGAHLTLSFDAASNAFTGTVENTTQAMLCAVRVEVHLSSGTELGPTERTDLGPGESTAVELPTGGEAFDAWTAHPEVSACSGG